MNFWEHQDAARGKSRRLVVYFLAAVVMIILAVYLVVAVFVNVAGDRPPGGAGAGMDLWQPELFLWCTLGTLALVVLGSLFKVIELAGHGRKVAEMLGGRPLNPATTDFHEKQLMNVVEEMALASGTPVPEVFILDNEKAINAFAAGTTPANAAIGVTRGCMKQLNRDELQGVIAHEFSHILNGDMRLNIRLIGILSGILCLAIIGRILLHIRGEKNPLPLLGLALMALGGIGLLFGRLIKSAVSRQREYLADAAAVQFTRNPDGIAGALKKIGGLAHGSRLQSSHAEEASHMFFGNGLAASWSQAFATHPPLVKRIQAIDPRFDGTFPGLDQSPAESSAAAAGFAANAPSGMAFAGGNQAAERPAAGARRMRLRADQVVDEVARPKRIHLDYAANLLQSLPGEIRSAAHEPFSACALVFGLLLSPDAAFREQQLTELEKHAPAPIFREIRRLFPLVTELDASFKLPLVDLSLPALRQLSPEQFQRFNGNVQRLIESDRQIDLFEFTLQRILLRHLYPSFQRTKPPRARYYGMQPLLKDSAVLLSGLARVGHHQEPEINRAFNEGAGRLGTASSDLRLLDSSACNLPQMDESLSRFAEASPGVKRRLIDALAHTVVADGEVNCREAELLRAMADTLDCPIPPFVQCE